jgi:hypothetical protein
MKRIDINRKCSIIDKHIASGGEQIQWEYTLQKNAQCELILAEWWDGMKPIAVIYIDSTKLKKIVDDFKCGIVADLYSHGNYYLAAFKNDSIEALIVMLPIDVIRFLISCFGSLDDLPKRSSSYVPVLHL